MSTLKVGTIQDHANSNTAITIGSDGFIIPKIRTLVISKNGNQNISAASSTTVTTWNTHVQSGLTWDDGNNRVNISTAQAGTYEIHYQLSAYMPSNDGGDIRANVLKNGTKEFGAYNLVVQGSTGTNPFDLRHYTMDVHGFVTVTNGDNISFEAYINTSGTATVFAGDGNGARATNVIMKQLT